MEIAFRPIERGVDVTAQCAGNRPWRPCNGHTLGEKSSASLLGSPSLPSFFHTFCRVIRLHSAPSDVAVLFKRLG